MAIPTASRTNSVFLSFVSFVEIHGRNAGLWDHCASDNELPKEHDRGLADHLPQDYIKKYEGLEGVEYPAPKKMVHFFGDIIKGRWYFKTGRSTGVASGICHGTETFCKITTPEDRKKRIYNAAGTHSEYADHGYTNELIIIKLQFRKHRPTTQEAMSLLDDSGSVYLDNEGMPAGLGFGGISGACGPMACKEKGWVDPTSGDIKSQREQLIGNFYGANIGLVTRMSDIQKYLRQRINGELDFC